MNIRPLRSGPLVLFLLVGTFLLVASWVTSPLKAPTRGYSAFLADVGEGRVTQVIQRGEELGVILSDQDAYEVVVPSALTDVYADMQAAAADAGRTLDPAIYSARATGDPGWLAFLVTSLLPIALIGGLLWFMLRQNQGGANSAMNFGRSRARAQLAPNRGRVSFADVAGADEAKAELAEVVEFLKFPEKFNSLGARIPRGVLLVGAPGTGKTLLARAVAGEAGVPFFSISGSEFVEMFVGVGASRVRDLFDQAKRNAPCIIFVDEIDAVGRQRGTGLGGGHDEREQTLNQILVEMDGFEPSAGVIVIAATNRPDILDPALLRPGRFDRRVILDRPDLRGRIAILRVHAKGKPLGADVDLAEVARRSSGSSGADLANIMNEAAILAARRDRKTIAGADFLEALDRVSMGPARAGRVMSDAERTIVAYHEGGHALLARLLPDAEPVAKVTIIGRGSALGYTLTLPEEDRYLRTRAAFEAEIAVYLGGHVAERLVFGDITTGASNDIEQATRIARAMVTSYGMSELGPRTLGRRDELVFLGRELGERRDYSEDLAARIDAETKAIVLRGEARATELLTTHRSVLDALAASLLERETVEGAELEVIFAPLPERVAPSPRPRPEPAELRPARAPRRSPRPRPEPA